MTDFEWRKKANCLGADLSIFFPTRGVNIREAKQICEGCTVRQECFDEAVATEDIGVRGGTTYYTRKILIRKGLTNVA